MSHLRSHGRRLLIITIVFFISATSTSARFDQGTLAKPFTDHLGRPVIDHAGRSSIKDERGKSLFNDPWPSIAQPKETLPSRLDHKASSVKDEGVDLEWHYAPFGTGIGASGLHVVDLDGDGETEILASSSSAGGFYANDFWYTLNYRNGEYKQTFIQVPYPGALTALRTFNFDNDIDVEVIAGVNHSVLVYDGTTLDLERTIVTDASQIRGLELADVDGDGQVEVVLCDPQRLYIYDAVTGVLERNLDGFGCDDLAIGNVDSDPDLEIVVANDSGTTGWVLNGRTGEVEWSSPEGFGLFVELADVDGDEREEIVSGYRWYRIAVYDADSQSSAYEIAVYLDLDALYLYDIDSDGTLELIYGDRQDGDVHVHDATTGIHEWSFVPPYDSMISGATNFAIGDTDGDDNLELLWGSGYFYTGPDYLNIIDTLTQHIEWQNQHINGPFYGIDYGDVDVDGSPELLLGANNTQGLQGLQGDICIYCAGIYLFFDEITKELEYQSPQPSVNDINDIGTTNGLRRIRHANIDDDPQSEIMIAIDDGYEGKIICYDGITHEKQWIISALSGETFESIQVVDVDQDGQLEIVAATGQVTSGVSTPHVYVYDASDRSLEWQSSEYLGKGNDRRLVFLRIANIDDDSNPEIIVADWYGGHYEAVAGNMPDTEGALYVYDGITKELQLEIPDIDITALDVAATGGGANDLIIGEASGIVKRINGKTGKLIEVVGNFASPIHGSRINGLDVVDITDDGILDYVLSLKNEVLVINGRDGRVAWRSDFIGWDVGVNDSLLVADIDEDDKKEIMVNTGTGGVMIFEVTQPPELSPNTRPVVLATDSLIVEATGHLTEVDFTTTAWDEEDGELIPTPSPAGPYSVGEHEVVWLVTDSAGAISPTVKQMVVITDTTAPTILLPNDIVMTATGMETAVDIGHATAYDLVDYGVAVTPSTTGPFEIGTHTVTWTASDSRGNTTTADQTITIEAPFTPGPESCDLNNDGGYTGDDIRLFVRDCLRGTAAWQCDVDGNGTFSVFPDLVAHWRHCH